MRIFISHKMPVDAEAVKNFGDRLALYAGTEMEIFHAGKFEKGSDFREKIEETIRESDVFILFYTSDAYDWSFSILECGLFKAKLAMDTRSQLIVLHDAKTRIPESLNDLNAVEATKVGIVEMLRGFYLNDPWKIKPDLALADIEDLAADLFHIFYRTQPAIVNFDLVPNFMIQLGSSDGLREMLSRGELPENAAISGSQGWQALFGKNADTGAWTWGQLVESWTNKALYEFQFASMISQAIERNSPKGCYLQMPDSLLIYRLSLRRFEQTIGTDVRKFFFTAAPMDVETYWLPEGSSKSHSTTLFHLVNLTWFVRRRLVDIYYSRLIHLLSRIKPDATELKKLIREIYSEIVLIEIQSMIRGIDTPKIVRDALTPKAADLTRKGKKRRPAAADAAPTISDTDWDDFKKLIFDAMITKDEPNYGAVAAAIYKISAANTDYYKKVATAYADDAQDIKLPDEPTRASQPTLPEDPTNPDEPAFPD